MNRTCVAMLLSLLLIPCALFAQKNAQELLLDIEEQIPLAATREERYGLLMRQAELALLSGDMELAQMAWQNGSFVYPGEGGIDYAALLKSAQLLFELGDNRIARTQAGVVASDAGSPALREEAELLLRRITLLEGAPGDETAGDAEGLAALFWEFQYAGARGDLERRELIKQRLAETWPDSPETMIAEGRARKAERFTDFLFLDHTAAEAAAESAETPETSPEKEAQQLYLQAGSFTNRENAEYLIIDLNTAGFVATLKETDVGGQTYYRVVLPVDKTEMEQFMIELKGAGFEASPLY